VLSLRACPPQHPALASLTHGLNRLASSQGDELRGTAATLEPDKRPPKGNPYDGLRILGPGQQKTGAYAMTRRRHPKPEIHAIVFAQHEHCVTELIVELSHAVIGATGYVHAGNIEFRANVSDHSAESFGRRVAFSNVCGAELDEMRAAVRKIERIRSRMMKDDKALGEAPNFAEFARRALVAAGVAMVHVARDLAGRPRNAAHHIVVSTANGGDVLDAIGRLEKIALTMFGKRVEAA
jgi:hypothetical protein